MNSEEGWALALALVAIGLRPRIGCQRKRRFVSVDVDMYQSRESLIWITNHITSISQGYQTWNMPHPKKTTIYITKFGDPPPKPTRFPPGDFDVKLAARSHASDAPGAQTKFI